MLQEKLEADLGAPIKVFERERGSLGVDDLAYWSRSNQSVPFRWSVYEDDQTRAVLVLTGTSKYILSVEAELTSKA